MLHNTQYIQDFMAYYNYPAEAVKAFTELEALLDENEQFGAKQDALVEGYMGDKISLRDALSELDKLSEEYGVNRYTLHFVFLMNCTPILKENYAKRGVDEKIFWDTMADLRHKLIECIDCEEVPGTFVADWNDGFFKMERFAYGRFQYEYGEYEGEDFTTACGKVFKKGDPYIGFHIPSSGIPLTDDVRLDSYKQAYPHFKHLFPDGKVIFGTHSWLLFQEHREFLPKHLNILRFMDDFEIIERSYQDTFTNGWRVFGKDSDLPIDQLPRKTSLQRAYADWLLAGNKTGNAFGIIVFDGEKILR